MVLQIYKKQTKKNSQIFKRHGYYFLFEIKSYPRNPSRIPAATAEPITPATFGPIAWVSRWLDGSASSPTDSDTLAESGTADTPALPIRKKIEQIGLKNIANGAREREFIKIFKEKSFSSLEYFNPGSNLSFRIKWCDTPQGRKVEINGVPLRSVNWSNSLEVICYEF